MLDKLKKIENNYIIMIEFIPINPQNNYEAIEDDFIKGLLKNTLEH